MFANWNMLKTLMISDDDDDVDYVDNVGKIEDVDSNNKFNVVGKKVE